LTQSAEIFCDLTQPETSSKKISGAELKILVLTQYYRELVSYQALPSCATSHVAFNLLSESSASGGRPKLRTMMR